MTNEQIELLIKQELEILEGWMRSYDLAQIDPCIANATYCWGMIRASNARLEKLEKQLRKENDATYHTH